MLASGFGWGAERTKSQFSRYGHYVRSGDLWPSPRLPVIPAARLGTRGMAKYRLVISNTGPTNENNVKRREKLTKG